MKQFTRFFTRIIYKGILKPVLFLMKPDGVHSRMILSGRLTQCAGVLRWLESACWAHSADPALRQEVFGLEFKNPLGLSAGLDKNAEIVPTCRAIGFGFTTVGSITASAAPGNRRPWYHRLPETKSIVVNAGLPNAGVKVIGHRIAAYADKYFDGFHLVASVAKTNSPEACTDEKGVRDYVAGVKGVMDNPHVRMIEINISCPNTYGGEPFTRPEPLEALLKEVDALRLSQPVVVKMPIDKPWPEFENLLKVIVRHKVAGVTIGNLQKNRAKVTLKDPLPDSIPGNLSGQPCFEDSNELIRRTYHTYGDKLTIIGVGGVFTAEDAYAKILAGASLVDMITGLIFEGPQVVGQINHDLAKLLRRDGYSSMSEAVGAAHKTSNK